MRRTGPIRFFVQGDESLATQYFPIARKLAGYLQNQADLLGDKQWVASRKVNITDGAIIDVQKIGEFLYNAYIDVRSVEIESRIVRALQYQFVYAGDAGKLWAAEVSEFGHSYLGGSTTVVFFLQREDGTVAHATFPLVSTIQQPPNNEWLYLPQILGSVGSLLGALAIPRYEVAHASTSAIENVLGTLHTAWMPKGERHYLAGGFNVAELRQAGTLNAVPITGTNQPGFAIQDSPRRGYAVTDITYESDLRVYQPPRASAQSFLNAVQRGSYHFSAPDMDWYTSYGAQRVELPDGSSRDFGVMIDAAQRVYVWPLKAAGTGWPDPQYIPQLIKTNVSDYYVKSQVLQFPETVRVGIGPFRSTLDNTEDFNAFFDGPLRDRTRYVWHSDFDGKEFCTLVEIKRPLGIPYTFLTERFMPEAGEPTFMGEEYRVPNPQPAKFTVNIEVTGDKLEDFEISVSPVELIDVPNDFFPVQVRYASSHSYPGVSRGELLIGGFSVRRLEDSIDTWHMTQTLNSLKRPNGLDWIFLDAERFVLNCSALFAFGLPLGISRLEYVDEANGGVITPPHGFVSHRNLMYHYSMPRYMIQDMPFCRLGELPEGFRPNGASVTPGLADRSAQSKSFVLEGEFKVLRGEDTVFRICCRKFKNNSFDFGNFFTARICDLDIDKGAAVVGLCESTTEVSTVANAVPNYPGTALADLRNQTGKNTSKKGYAIYAFGSLVEFSDNELASQLNTPLTSIPINKDLAFWGTIGFDGIAVLPPSPHPFITVGMLNWQYAEHLFSLVGNTIRRQYIGIPQFPWGLEMHAWFYRNHLSFGREQGLWCDFDTEFHALSAVYLDIKNPVEVDCLTHELIADPELELVLVDTIRFAGQSFTHAALYEEAFGQPAQTKYDVRAESVLRADGYSHRVSQSEWVKTKIFLPAASYYADGVRYYSESLIHPDLRVYCTLDSLRGRINWPDELNSLPTERAAYGSFRQPFLAAVCAEVEIND